MQEVMHSEVATKKTAGDIKWAHSELHFLKAGVWNDQWERMIL